MPMGTNTIVLFFLPILPVIAYLAIKYPAYVFMFFFCAASLEGGFVSEVRTITLTRFCFLLLVPSFIIYMVTRARCKKYDPTVFIIVGGFFVYYFLSYLPLWIKNDFTFSSISVKLSASSLSFWEHDFPKAITST